MLNRWTEALMDIDDESAIALQQTSTKRKDGQLDWAKDEIAVTKRDETTRKARSCARLEYRGTRSGNGVAVMKTAENNEPKWQL